MLNNESFCSENDLCTDVYNEGKERGWFSSMRTMYCLGLCNVHERLTVLNGFSWDIVPSGTTLMFEYSERLSSRHHKYNNKINLWGQGVIVLKTSFKWTTWMHTDREQLSVDENNESAICFHEYYQTFIFGIQFNVKLCSCHQLGSEFEGTKDCFLHLCFAKGIESCLKK